MGKRKSVRQPLLEADDELSLPQDERDDTAVSECSSSILPARDESLDSDSKCSSLYISGVSGPGVQSATANYPSHVLVELSDTATGRPCACSYSHTVTAELHSETEEEKQHSLFKRQSRTYISVEQKGRATYQVSFTASSRGEHQLHIKVDGMEIRGSPCNITLYPDPKQLHKPVDEIPALTNTWDVTTNSRGEIIASNFSRNEVLVLNSQREVILSFDCRGPTGIAIDGDDNVYVSCADQIQKFSRDGHLMKSVGRCGQKEGEFIRPEGITCYDNCIYVCDMINNRIQVFDTDLNYIKTFGTHGTGNMEFHHPWDIDIDSAGRAYIADQNNSRVQVIDINNGTFLKVIGDTGGKGKLRRPTSVRILGEFLYVSDDDNSRVAVFHTSGEYVTSFGTHRDSNGKKYRGPSRLCSDKEHFIYVVDLISCRVF